jgi:hypothetical protein
VKALRKHIVLPDTQVKPGQDTAYLSWAGRYIVDEFAGQDIVVVHLGDHWDMPSLSSYDKGRKAMEGRRYVEDIAAGNEGFDTLNEPFERHNRYRRHKWLPEKHLLRGNHEDRITRAAESDAQLDGLLSLDQLESFDWAVHDYLVPVTIDGVVYAHYFYRPLTGRPYSGQAITRLKELGHSFTMGHQQTLDYAVRFVNGRSQHGLIAGAYYTEDEDYKGPQGNAHWRGIVVCHEVEDGSYSPMFVSIDYLCRRYEGKRLVEYMKAVK